MLLLPEGQTAKPGNLPTSCAISENRGVWIKKYFHFHFFRASMVYFRYCNTRRSLFQHISTVPVRNVGTPYLPLIYRTLSGRLKHCTAASCCQLTCTLSDFPIFLLAIYPRCWEILTHNTVKKPTEVY